MNTSKVKQRAPMFGYHQRKDRNAHPTTVSPRATLPPVTAFDGAPVELRDALDTWHALAATAQQHTRAVRTKEDAAKAADDAYSAAVRTALADGSDPAKIKPSRGEQYRAEAKAHRGFAEKAIGEQTRAGMTLGPLLEQHAPVMFGNAEAKLDESTTRVRAALASLQDALVAEADAFGLRVWLSKVALGSGTVPIFHGGAKLRPAVVDSLNALENHLGELDRLKSDEAEVIAFRKTNADAAAEQPVGPQRIR